MTRIIDLHCDTMMHCYFDKTPFRDLTGHINPDKLRRGGSLCQALALFIPTDGTNAPDGGSPWELYKNMLACWKKEIAANSGSIRQVYNVGDIRQNMVEGYLSALLTVEDGIGVDGRMERLEEMYADGVRMLALTWNFENCFGYPNSADPELHKRGLKEFGRDAVARMNELGMIVDVSHLSEGGFYDVAEISKAPFVASHSCARALRDHQRNLTDDQLRRLADCGGVVGINFCSDFLSEDRVNTYADDIVRHLDHMRNVAGADALAWGSDFDGIESKLDFEDFAGFPILVDKLSAKFTAAEIDKICYGNFLRLAGEVLR